MKTLETETEANRARSTRITLSTAQLKQSAKMSGCTRLRQQQQHARKRHAFIAGYIKLETTKRGNWKIAATN
jgi:hypothetical protein